jgi:hypothetical protein
MGRGGVGERPGVGLAERGGRVAQQPGGVVIWADPGAPRGHLCGLLEVTVGGSTSRVSVLGLRSCSFGEPVHGLAGTAHAVLEGFPHEVAEDAVDLGRGLEPGLISGTLLWGLVG